jgi:hypothetical protein
MVDVTNRERADWANDALEAFMETTGCDVEDALADLLCDLMHWADRHDQDFSEECRRAIGHYEAEVEDEN